MSQTTFNYNGIEVEFDAFDADNMDAFDNALDSLRKDETNLPKDGKASDLIRAQCKMLRNFFDRLFGAGTGEKICGSKDSYTICKNAYMAFLDFIQEQKTQNINEANEFRSRYSGNRAQRRAAIAPASKKT